MGEEEEQLEGVQPNEMADELVLPDVYCSYSFRAQFKAVFYRKAATTFRSLSTLSSIVLPVFFILLGVVLVCVVFEGDSDTERFLKRYLMAYFFVWGFVFNTSTYCGDLVLEREKRFKF